VVWFYNQTKSKDHLEFIMKCLEPCVWSVAKNYPKTYREDLASELRIVILKHVPKYDSEKSGVYSYMRTILSFRAGRIFRKLAGREIYLEATPERAMKDTGFDFMTQDMSSCLKRKIRTSHKGILELAIDLWFQDRSIEWLELVSRIEKRTGYHRNTIINALRSKISLQDAESILKGE
jgi:hypothetical protein